MNTSSCLIIERGAPFEKGEGIYSFDEHIILKVRQKDGPKGLFCPFGLSSLF